MKAESVDHALSIMGGALLLIITVVTCIIIGLTTYWIISPKGETIPLMLQRNELFAQEILILLPTEAGLASGIGAVFFLQRYVRKRLLESYKTSRGSE